MTPIVSLPTLAATTIVAATAAFGLGGHIAHANSDPFGGSVSHVHAAPLYREPTRLARTTLRSVHCLGHARGTLCFAAKR